MPEESTGAGAPLAQPTEGQQPNAGASTQPTQPTSTPNGTPEGNPPSANKLIKDFVAEHGMTVEELLSDYTTLKDANKTELERLTGQVDDFKAKYEQATTELRNTRSESAFLEAAQDARAPKMLYRAVRDEITYDKQGNPTNLAEVIAAVREKEPDLFRASGGSGDAGRGSGTTNTTDINSLIRQMAEQAR